MFTTREDASFMLLGALVLACFAVPSIRPAVFAVVRALLQPKLAALLVLFAGTIAAAVVLAYEMDAWTPELTGATVLWFLITGGSLFINVTKAGEDKRFFRHRAAETLKIAAFLEFLLNLRPLSVATEIVVQLVLTLIVLVHTYAGTDERHRRPERFLGFLLAVFGSAMLGITIAYVVGRWSELEKPGLARLLVLPMWLTLAALIAVYVIVVFVEYESAFLRMRFASGMASTPVRAKLALVLVLRGRPRLLHQFGGQWPRRLLGASSLRLGMTELSEFRRSVTRSS